MVETSINDLYMEVSALISDKKYNNGRVYWSGLFDHQVSCIKYGMWMYIKLPSPKLAGCMAEYKRKKQNEAEIERVRGIWQEFIRIFKEKMERVDTGQSKAEEEFKDGILLENGEFGLRCGKGNGWKL